MLTVTKDVSPVFSYPPERLGALSDLLFFDIETTGFSARRNRLYLIGCLYREADGWKLVQWFADRKEAEPELLSAFFDLLASRRTLIHFNGEGFDLPFIRQRAEACGIAFPSVPVTGVDLYRKIRPLGPLLGLEHLKQKQIETFLNVSREDRFGGGELIRVYEEYLRSPGEDLLRILLLHNEDDLKGMPSILPVLFYPDFLNGPFTFLCQELTPAAGKAGPETPVLTLTYEGPVSLPVPAAFEQDGYALSLSGRRLTLSVRLFDGELKHFYSDYQNYYYLIYEGYAVHKSVGQFVDRAARKKATARTCFTRARGLFLPQPAPLWPQRLKTDYSDRRIYAPYSPSLFAQEKTALLYLGAVLSAMRLLAAPVLAQQAADAGEGSRLPLIPQKP